MKATYTFKPNLGKIRQLSAAQVAALRDTAESLLTDVTQAQVVPYREGTLQNDQTFVSVESAQMGSVQLISSTPYARRLYYHPEYNFSQKENPNAKGRWYEDWLEGGTKENFCKNAFKRHYRRRAQL
jgi:hypothetical protein